MKRKFQKSSGEELLKRGGTKLWQEPYTFLKEERPGKKAENYGKLIKANFRGTTLVTATYSEDRKEYSKINKEVLPFSGKGIVVVAEFKLGGNGKAFTVNETTHSW